jgi:hypothetical protein
MKTRLQWFNELPKDISEKAIANAENDMLGLECNNMTQALEGAFFWEDCPEGYRYWIDIYNAYDELEMALEEAYDELDVTLNSIKQQEHA